MTKRKRTQDDQSLPAAKAIRVGDPGSSVFVQIVTGSYERVLHGITAAISKEWLESEETRPEGDDPKAVTFADSFLFNAHTSAIRCLALSPIPAPAAASQKVILATGSTDERVNLYHLSTRPPNGPVLPSLKSSTLQNPGNKSLGTLHTHDASITALYFPSKAKLISSCANNILAITSTRNWNTLSMIKAPTPKHPNRPTGDTSTASTLPAGVNDFAVHPSMKLMISVGRAERCMRLWNLVTGKKAGVLNFSREMLREVGESTSRWGSGEGRKVIWNNSGHEFAVAFEWGLCIFGEVRYIVNYAVGCLELMILIGLQTQSQSDTDAKDESPSNSLRPRDYIRCPFSFDRIWPNTLLFNYKFRGTNKLHRRAAHSF
jgi:protein MAK11